MPEFVKFARLAGDSLCRQVVLNVCIVQRFEGPRNYKGMKMLIEKTKFKSLYKVSMLGLCVALSACEQNPKEAVDSILVDVGGYLSYQNPIEDVNTGTIVGGIPASLSYYAPGEECFPSSAVRRHYNHEYLDKKYMNQFQGNVGFLSWGASAISGGGSLSKEHLVVIEINGITVEYLNAPDVTRYYRSGMDDVCKDYLDEFGFVVQSAMTEKLSISIYDRTGTKVWLDETNINEYITISGDMDWEIINSYRVDVTTPHYLGYHLGQLRKSDGQMVRRRARSEANGRFVFEDDGVFDPDSLLRPESFMIRSNPETSHLYVPFDALLK